MATNRERAPGGKVRYAVVGLGWISQAAMLPAFAHARENSALTALVSDDPKKLEELGDKPMANTEAECEAMIRACAEARVKLMIAYRLHFEEANMTAAELIASGE